MEVSCTSREWQGRPRERYQKKIKSPLHLQQLLKIKAQYLSQQHEESIDRDTVLKINRLTTRKYAQKRESSWPPSSEAMKYRHFNFDNFNNKHSVRSSSNDNSFHFDKNVCRRHAIDDILKKFSNSNNLNESIEIKEQGRQKKTQSGLQRNAKLKYLPLRQKRHSETTEENSKSQFKNLCSKSCISERSPKKNIEVLEERKDETIQNVELEQAKPNYTSYRETNSPAAELSSHPETKAAKDLGLVEPRMEHYEQLKAVRKWCSIDNLVKAAKNTEQDLLLIHTRNQNSQPSSLERELDNKHTKQALPPKKPRISGSKIPLKLQRHSIRMATEIKICYDSDEVDQELHLESVNTDMEKQNYSDMENVPLPEPPAKCVSQHFELKKVVPFIVECSSEGKTELCDLILPINEHESYDTLLSQNLHDQTLAYLPTAIRNVPSSQLYTLKTHCELTNLNTNGTNLTQIELMSPDVKTADIERTYNHGELKRCQKQKEKPNNQHCCLFLKGTSSSLMLFIDTEQDGISTRSGNGNNKSPSKMNKPAKVNDKTSFNEKKNHAEVLHKDSSLLKEERKLNFVKLLDSSSISDKTKNNSKNATSSSRNVMYYTDGEYLYGPNYSTDIVALSHINIKPSILSHDSDIQSENVKFKKNYSRNTNSDITSKYEHIQKSISEHLRHIDEYIENAKTALKATAAMPNSFTKNYKETLNIQKIYPYHKYSDHHILLAKTQPLKTDQMPADGKKSQSTHETPLQCIKRKVLSILDDKSLQCDSDVNILPVTNGKNSLSHFNLENTEIVKKVLEDLNILATQL